MLYRFLIVLLVFSSAKVGSADTTDELPISVSAALIIMQGSSWTADMTPNGALYMNAYYHNPSGAAITSFAPDKLRVDAVRQAIEEFSFFTLPESIVPETLPMHEPDWHLEIMVGDKKHSVRVYDPMRISVQTDDITRFFKVWDAVFNNIPLRPNIEPAR